MNKVISTNIDISITAGELPNPMIYRPHVIDSIRDFFDADHEVVCLEGKPGHGKTTILHEFAATIERPCFSVFLGATGTFSYDPLVARRDLIQQAHWYLKREPFPPGLEISDGQLRSYWNRCAKSMNQRRTAGFIVVDGIDDLPTGEDSAQRAILDLIPLGIHPFQVLISASSARSVTALEPGLQIKPFPIMAFSLNETQEFLEDVANDAGNLVAYHKSVGGVPSSLASIRRQLQDRGKHLQLRLTQNTSSESLLQSEWATLLPLSDQVTKILAFIVASGKPTKLTDLSTYSGVAEEELLRTLRSIPFLCHSSGSDGWYFPSRQFRLIVEQELVMPIQLARESLAKTLLENPDSESAFDHLPFLFEHSENIEPILDWFTEDRLAHLLLSSGNPTSTEPVLRKVIAIAHENQKDESLAFYSLSRSIIQQLSRTAGLDEEIRARGALHDFRGAQLVANSAPILTQRVRLLSNLVEVFAESPGIEIDAVKNEILGTAKKIDFSSLPQEDAIDLASDLYPVDSSLALKILKEAIDDDIEDTAFEVALAKLSLSAIARNITDGTEGEARKSTNVAPIDLVVDKKLKYLLRTAAVSTHAHTARKLLDATDDIDDASERLFVQRKWLLHNYKRSDAAQVLEKALNDALASSDYAPNASFYREISTALPYVPDRQTRARLRAILEGQSAIAKNKGPTIEYVRFQLHLAHSEVVDEDLKQAADRLETLYLDTLSEIHELETRVSSLAWFVSSTKPWPKSQNQVFAAVEQQVNDDLDETISSVITDGAGQFEAVSGALEALSPLFPRVALDIAKKLNTTHNREQGYSKTVHTICESDNGPRCISALFELLDLIEPGPTYDRSLLAITERLCDDRSHDNLCFVELDQVMDRVKRCTSLRSKCKALGYLAKYVNSRPDSQMPLTTVTNDLIATFSKIESPTRKYSVACQLISMLHDDCPKVSNHVLEFLSNFDNNKLYTQEIEKLLFHNLELTAKAIGALCKSSLLRDQDLDRFLDLCSELKDPTLRTNVASTAAFYLWHEDKTRLFSKVVNDQIWPTLNGLTRADAATLYDSWISAFPVVWLENRDRAREAVRHFPDGVTNHCISSLCMALLRKQPPGEPFDSDYKNQKKKALTFADVQNLLQLCNETNEDRLIFSVFEWIADDLGPRSAKHAFTRDQRAEIARAMVEIAVQRLPMRQHIRHDGYKILCLAQGVRIDPAVKINLEELTNDADGIGNSADRLFVLSHLASYLPQKNKQKRSQLFERIEEESGKLTIASDRYERFHLLAIHSRHSDVPMSTRAIEKAFSITTQLPGTQNIAREDRLLDLAYRIDPDLPMKLGMAYDSDPARQKYIQRARRQIGVLKLKKDLGDQRRNIHLSARENDRDLASAAWNALGSLNSGRMLAVDMNRSRDMLQCASNYPMDTAYPMYSWVISNITHKYAKTGEASLYVRGVFEGVMRTTRFLLHLSSSDKSYTPSPPWQAADIDHHVMVKIGERDKGLQFIQSWMEESAEEYLTIVDPYFRTTDLELLRTIAAVNPKLDVFIITGKSDTNQNASSLSETYSIAWREMCDDTPPKTEILVVREVTAGVTPIHDRWILSKNTGLRLGSSINSLGNRDSEISKMDSIELASVKARIREYQDRQIRDYEGSRISYEWFELHH